MSGGRYESRISRPSVRKLRSIQDRAEAIGYQGTRGIDAAAMWYLLAGRVRPRGGHDERQGRWEDRQPVRLPVLGLGGARGSGVRPGPRPVERVVGRRRQGAL